MRLAPVIRFPIVAGVLGLAVVVGYFSGDPKTTVFLFGASIMLFLPLSLVSLIDVVRHKGFGEGSRSRVIRAALSVPLVALALGAAAIGVYLLAPMVIGTGGSTWPNIFAGGALRWC